MEAMRYPAAQEQYLRPYIPPQATNDTQLVDLWLRGKSEKTVRDYRADIGQFFEWVKVPVQQVTLQHIYDFLDSISSLAVRTQNRKLSAIKSLLSFAHKAGYTIFNVGAAVNLHKVKNDLAERILSEADMQRILALEADPRNSVLLRLMYSCGGRVSEICGLKWRDVQERLPQGGQVTLYGKGGKTRAVLLSEDTWKMLQKIRKNQRPDIPVFRSRKGGHLTPTQVWRIVRAAADRAGVEGNVSPHWFRHCHASHALDRGCPIHLVQATLGHSNTATTGRYLHVRPGDSSARYLPV